LSKNVIFCYYCKLFSTSKTKLGTDGSNDWRHVSTILKEHETSNSHLRAHQTWIEFSSRLKSKKTFDDSNQRILESEKKYWNAVLQRIVSVIQLLGQQNLAFRGSSDQLYKQNNGNFLKIIELMALYDPVISEHVRRTMNSKNKTHYLGKDIQNEIISLISGAIKTRAILNMVKESKYYSIILDCIPDLSHVEQMTIIMNAGRIKARRVKKQFDYKNMDEPIIDPKINFKVDFFNNIFDIAINCINDRFEHIKEHSDYFSFLYDINKLKDMTYDNRLNHCKDLQLFLTIQGDSADINGLEMEDELRVIIPMVESNLSPIELLKFEINIGSFAPNLSIALRILLALPVTVASGERSFSKLKLIKTYLRSTMANDRLSGLAMIAIEHQLCQELDIEEIIKDFSNAKARKVFH